MFRMKITRYYYLIKINKNSQEIVQLASKNFPSQIKIVNKVNFSWDDSILFSTCTVCLSLVPPLFLKKPETFDQQCT